MKSTILAIAVLALASLARGADETEHPLFALWPARAGTQVQFNRTLQIHGGVPTPDDAPRVHASKVTYELTQATPQELTITVGQCSFSIPAKLAARAARFPKLTGNEEVTLGGKKYACKVYRYTTVLAETGMGNAPANNPDFPLVDVTVWVAPGVPGGVVRRKMAWLEKVSYTVEDTLIPPAPAGK